MAKTKRALKVEGAAPAGEGIRLVLNARLEEMCALRDQALNWKDPEGVHVMRVASRRLRSALRDFLPYVRRRPLLGCLREIRTIARALGRVRDYDVAILALQKLGAEAPPEFRAGILRFAKFRGAGLEEARIKLMPALAPDVLVYLRNNFPKALETALRPARGKSVTSIATPNGDQTYQEVAQQVILRRLDEFEELGKSFYRPLKIKPLHDLRLAAKHLRYALELFDDSWLPEGSQSLQAIRESVTAMQSSLGGLHDTDVWIENFGDVFIYESPGTDFDKRATSTWLLSYFVKMHGKHLGKALTQWNEWQTNRVGEQLRASLKTNT